MAFLRSSEQSVSVRSQVALSALRLTNAAAGDQQSLHALALQGLLPAVGTFTDRCLPDYVQRKH